MHPDATATRAAVTSCARAGALLAALAAAATACGQEPPPPQYRVTFVVRSDAAPMQGAQLVVQNRVVGMTDAQGTARLVFTGRDGQTVPVAVRCPTGTRSPQGPVNVTLRTLEALDRAAAARGIVETVDCPPQDRTLAVVVRAIGHPNLPIVWHGNVVSRTDDAGLAHLTFRARPTTSLSLTLATADAPTLRPQNPAQEFVVPDADDAVVWTQSFSDAAPRPRARTHHHVVHEAPRRTIIRLR